MANNPHRPKLSRESHPLKFFLDTVLIGIGIGVITGSLLKSISLHQKNGQLNLPRWFSIKELGPSKYQQEKNNTSFGTHLNKLFIGLEKEKEIVTLSKSWKALLAKQRGLEASAFLLSLDDGRYAKLNPDKSLPAASSIKTPILLVALQMIDEGKLRWNEPLTLTKDVIGGGAGWMAYQPLGKVFQTHEVATEMIRISDNTATNILIKRLGGMKFLNERFKLIGLQSTELKNWLPDLGGTNRTSARDLTKTFEMVDKGSRLSLRSRDLFREVMSTSKTNSLIPLGLLRGLGGQQGEPDQALLIKGYRVYNKTGDIGISYADAGLIQLPDGSRAVAGFIVKGPFNDPRSPRLIRDMASEMAPLLKPKNN